MLAYNLLGYCYAEGAGVPKDPQKAVEFFRCAHERGSVRATNNLAFCYRHGVGVLRDIQKSVEFYTIAVERGSIRAITYLGDYYSRTDGNKALEFYRIAHDKGCLRGAFKIGSHYTYCILDLGKKFEAILLFQKVLSQSNDKNLLKQSLSALNYIFREILNGDINVSSSYLYHEYNHRINNSDDFESIWHSIAKGCFIAYQKDPKLKKSIKSIAKTLKEAKTTCFEDDYWLRHINFIGHNKGRIYKFIQQNPNAFLTCLLKDNIQTRETKLELYQHIHDNYKDKLSAENVFLLHQRLGFLLHDLYEIRVNPNSYWNLVPVEIIQLVNQYSGQLLPTPRHR